MKYIGIDIGGTNLKAGMVDGEGQLLATRKMKVAGIADPAALAWTIHALVQDLCRDNGCDIGVRLVGSEMCIRDRWRSGAVPSCIPAICPCGTCRCGGCSTSSATCPFT